MDPVHIYRQNKYIPWYISRLILSLFSKKIILLLLFNEILEIKNSCLSDFMAHRAGLSQDALFFTL